MKITAKLMKDCTSVRLHDDGSAVLYYERKDKKTGATIEWVHVIKQTGIHCDFVGAVSCYGRYNQGGIALMLSADRVRARQADLDHGSENTKAKGIEVGTIAFNHGYGYATFHMIDKLISSDFTVNEGAKNLIKDQETNGLMFVNAHLSGIHIAAIA